MLFHKANIFLVVIFSFSSFSPSILPSMLLLLTNAGISFSQVQTDWHKRDNIQRKIEKPDFSVLSSFTSHFMFENVGLKPITTRGTLALHSCGKHCDFPEMQAEFVGSLYSPWC